MVRFLVGKPGQRWQFEVRAVPVAKPQPQTVSDVFESLMAEVGADSTSEASGDSYNVAYGYGDSERGW